MLTACTELLGWNTRRRARWERKAHEERGNQVIEWLHDCICLIVTRLRDRSSDVDDCEYCKEKFGEPAMIVGDNRIADAITNGGHKWYT